MSGGEFSYENSRRLVRRAAAADGAACARILHGWVQDTPWMPKLHSAGATRAFVDGLIAEQEVWVSDRSGVAGFLAHRGGTVAALFVDAEHRRCGVGAALIGALKAAEDWIGLWTFEANGTARGFYQKHGFAEVCRTCGAGNEEHLPDIRLEWRRHER